MSIVLVIIFLYLSVGEPIAERFVHDKFVKNKKTDKDARSKMYINAFTRVWIAGIIVISYFWATGTDLQELGFRGINTKYFVELPSIGKVLVVLAIICYCLYLLGPITIPYISKKYRDKILGMLESIMLITPATNKERIWWGVTSLTTTVEELLYRGFSFYFIKLLFPSISIWLVLAISSLVEGVRYIHRPITMIYATMSSVVFGIFFIVFDSLIAAALLHLFHDFRVFLMPLKAVRERLGIEEFEVS